MVRWRLTYFLLPYIAWVGCISLPAQESGQAMIPKEFKSHRELMQHIAAARASVVSCIFEAEITYSGDARLKCTKTNMYFEYSQVGNHSLVHIINITNCEIPPEYALGGRSGDMVISFTTRDDGKEIYMKRFDPSMDSNRKIFPTHFDWRAVGLGFCADFPIRNFEDISGSIAEWDLESPMQVVDGIVRFDDNPRIKHSARYQIDLKHGSFPILFEFEPNPSKPTKHLWRVEVDKFDGEYLPHVATLECQTLGTIMTITFKWLMVNEPLEGGKAACERIVRKFDHYRLGISAR